MGQYHYVANLDKREYLHPHKLNDGLKLVEFSQGLTMAALAGLLATSNGRGGGDYESHRRIGTWAADRIAIVGDYWEDSDTVGEDNPWNDLDENGEITGEAWTDISEEAVEMLRASGWWFGPQIEAAETAEWSLLKATRDEAEGGTA